MEERVTANVTKAATVTAVTLIATDLDTSSTESGTVTVTMNGTQVYLTVSSDHTVYIAVAVSISTIILAVFVVLPITLCVKNHRKTKVRLPISIAHLSNTVSGLSYQI